jgi:fibronectin type 3 domain-containing protein
MKTISRRLGETCAAVTGVLLICSAAPAQVSVTTQHNDNARTGQNLGEKILTTSNVNPTLFGKLFTRTVTGDINGQPVYVANVNLPSGTRNVVYVATGLNNVYAFDADDPAASAPLWQVNLGTPVTGDQLGANDASTSSYPAVPGWHSAGSGQTGVMSTPVIDPATGTIYVCAPESLSGDAQYVLHALDIVTGAEKCNGPVTIAGSVPGTGWQSVSGTLGFHADRQLQRPGLLLANDRVYIAFGGHADMEPYHGWVFGYGKTNLAASPVVFCSTPDGDRGAIWQSGQGLSADASGNVYAATGDGPFTGNSAGGKDFGDSLLQLNSSLQLTKYFTPFNENLMQWYQDASSNWVGDLDLGSSAGLLVPGTSLALVGSKDGKIYEIDTANPLGWGYNPGGDTQLVDSFQAGSSTFNLWDTHQVHSMVYWNGPGGPVVYAWPDSHTLQAYPLSGGQLVHPAPSVGSTSGGSFAGLAVSANGSTAGTGIVWAATTLGPALRAYDASDITTELWNSSTIAARDGLPSYAKWGTPTVVNGKVYVPTTSGQLVVYGLDTAYPPAGLRAAGGGRLVALSWTAAPGAITYNVKRGLSGSGPFTTIKTGITNFDVGGYSIGTYLDNDQNTGGGSGPVNGTTYYYVVSSVGATGEGPDSPPVSATPTAPPSSEAAIASAAAPPAIDGVPSEPFWSTATANPLRNVYLEVPTSSSDLSGNFKAAWDSTNLYVLYSIMDDATRNDSTNPWDDDAVEIYIDGDNSRGGSYDADDYEFVFGWDDTAIWSQFDKPTTGMAFAKTDTATGYYVEIKIPWATVSVAPTAGKVIGLDASVAEDDDGSGRDSRMAWIDNNNDDWHLPSIFGTGRLLPGGPPAAPTGLTATPGNTKITLSWTASTGATAYRVRRGTVSGGPYTTVASLVGTTWTNTGLVNGVPYYYVVAAENAAGQSPNSAQASATPGGPPAAPTGLAAKAGDAKVTLTWNASSGATLYRVRRGTVSGGPYTTVASLVGTAWANTGLTNGVTYYYVVAASNASGDSPNSAQVSAVPGSPPPAPTGLTATPGNAKVTLAWNASAGASGYRVRRSLISGGPYGTVASVAGTSWTNTGLTNGTTYYYVVAGFNASGDGPGSAEAGATPN